MAGERLDPNIPKYPEVSREPQSNGDDPLEALRNELQQTLHDQDPVTQLTAQLKFQRKLRRHTEKTLEEATLEGVGRMIIGAVDDLLTQTPRSVPPSSQPKPANYQPARDAGDAERNERERKEREAYISDLNEKYEARQAEDERYIGNLIRDYNSKNPNRQISGPGKVLIASRINIPYGDSGFQEAARGEFNRFVQVYIEQRPSGPPQSQPKPTSPTSEDSYRSPRSTASPVSSYQIHARKHGEDDEDGGWDTVKVCLTASAVLLLAVFGTLVWAMADDAQKNRPSTSPPPIPPRASEEYSAGVKGNFGTVMETPTPAPVSEPVPVNRIKVRGIPNLGKSPRARGCVWPGGEGEHDPRALENQVRPGDTVIDTDGRTACVFSSENPPVKNLDYYIK